MVKKGQLMNGRIKEMANHLLGRWASTEPAPQLESKRVSACRVFWYLLTADRKVALLIDKYYTGEELSRSWKEIDKGKSDSPAVVLYGDGQDFLRNWLEQSHLKGRYWPGLKGYSPEEKKDIYVFRAAEIFLTGRRDWLQYYRPDLEALVSYRFERVEWRRENYLQERLKGVIMPPKNETNRIYILKEEIKEEGKLNLPRGYLKGEKIVVLPQLGISPSLESSKGIAPG